VDDGSIESDGSDEDTSDEHFAELHKQFLLPYELGLSELKTKNQEPVKQDASQQIDSYSNFDSIK